GGGDRVAEWRVHHDHALGGRRRNVDIVDADAGATNDAELLGLLQELGGHLGGRAGGEPVELADHLGELVLVPAQLGLEHGLDAAILENLYGGIGQGIGNENARSHGSCPVFDLAVGRAVCVRACLGATCLLLMKPVHAALGSASLVLAKAQSSQSVNA